LDQRKGGKNIPIIVLKLRKLWIELV